MMVSHFNDAGVYMFELTRAGALSAARAELMMAIKAMKMKRIL